MDQIIAIHGLLKWPMFLAILAGLPAAFMGSLSPKMRRILGAAYVGIMDLQLVLGGILLFQDGALSTSARHVVFMVLALILAHGFFVRAKKNAFEDRRGRVLLFIVPSILVCLGLLQVL